MKNQLLHLKKLIQYVSILALSMHLCLGSANALTDSVQSSDHPAGSSSVSVTATSPAVTNGEKAQSHEQLLNKSLISLNVKNADVRDVLSALALNVGCNIIYKGSPALVTLKLEEVSAADALDYVAKVAGLIYIQDDDIIIVGDRASIGADFSDRLEIVEFKLKYITAQTLSDQILSINMKVNPLSVKSNSKTLWVQGYASDLVKIRQMIRMLDKNANIELGSAEIKNNFRAIPVEYISAAELQSILDQLSLPSGFTLDGNPSVLYVYASEEDFNAIQAIKAIVDVVENYSLEGSYFTSKKIELYKLKYVTTESVKSIFSEMGTEANIDVQVFSTDKLKKAIWISGSVDAIREAKTIISAIDVPEMNIINTFQVFRLYNITAAEMVKRLEMLQVPDLKVYTFPYASFSRSIIVSCQSDYMNVISQMIDTLDRDSATITMPVDSSSVENGASRLYNRRILISELSGIPISSFKISSNIAKDDGYRFVMYLTASPEDIQRVKDIIAEIDGV